MNKQRIIALALAGVLAISLLASCSSSDADTQDDTLENETVLTPDADTDVDTDVDADVDTDTDAETDLEEDSFDEDALNDSTVGAPEDDLDSDMDVPVLDDNSQNDTTVAPPATTTTPVVPEAEPDTTTPSVDAMSKVEAVWTDIEALGEMPLFGDAEGDILVSFYGVDLSHLEEVICKVPMINVTATEFFIAKVTSGNMDAVKAACESRQAALVAEWSNYLPEQLDLVKDYQLVTNGDYIFFGIGYNVDEAVDIFNSYTK